MGTLGLDRIGIRLGSYRSGSSSPLLTGLVSYWKLDEVSGQRNDSAGTNHLTDNNTVSSADQGGTIGVGALFVSADSDFLSRTSLNWATLIGSTFTIAGWLTVNTNVGNAYALSWNGNNSGAVNLYWVPGNDSWAFYTDTGHILNGAGTTAPANGSLHFVVAWRDNADGSIHIQTDNGTEMNTMGSVAPASTSVEMDVGRFSGGSNHLNGLINELGIWSRVLSAADKTYLYNSGAGRSYPFS